MANGEMQALPEGERELYGIISRKLNVLLEKNYTPEAIYKECEGNLLLVDVTSRLVDSDVLQKVFTNLSIPPEAQIAVRKSIDDAGFKISISRPLEEPEEIDEMVSPRPWW